MKVSVYLNPFCKVLSRVQPYLSEEFTDDIYKSGVITAGLKNEFCELRYIIVFLVFLSFFLSFFFFNVTKNNVPFISCSAVKVLVAQSSKNTLKLKSIWSGH